jgi:hypothetical protein
MIFKPKLHDYFYSGVDESGKHHCGVFEKTDIGPAALHQLILDELGGYLIAFYKI